MQRTRTAAGISVALAVAVAAAYREVTGFEFLNYDDDTYVTGNSVVRAGLSPAGAAWALRTFHAANWHPLTWLSHLLDASLFGLDAGAHHAMSAALHALATALLFLVLRALTGATWPPALAAGLFGLHPLHVESVAWVSERKDVLCGLFVVLALGAHLAHARRPGPGRLALVSVLGAFALLAKPMAVTLPLLLLLADWWPLGRAGLPGTPGRASRARALIVEKLPLFALAAATGIVTLLAQRAGGALKPLAGFPLALRVEVALLAVPRYVIAALAPVNLAAVYPYPAPPGPGLVLGAAAALGAATFLAFRQARRRPWLLCGWLWYLGMLFPVLGLVQAGVQPWADRYTYLPLVGLFVAAAWSGAELAGRSRLGGAAFAAASLAALTALGVGARAQAATWRDSRTLFERAVAVTGENYVARHNLAAALLKLNRTGEAVAQYREAVRLHPRDPEPREGLAFALAEAGRIGEAVEQYRLAKEFGLPPGADPAPRRREIERAAVQFAAPFAGDLRGANARLALGLAAADAGRLDEALAHFGEAIRLAPNALEPRHNLAVMLTRAGRHAEAAAQFEELTRLFPGRRDLAERLREARSRR